MATLLKAIENQDGGITIFYRIGGDVRSLYLAMGDISGLMPAEIKTLAQSRANTDLGSDGSILPNVRQDIVSIGSGVDLTDIIDQGENEIAYLDSTIPNIDTMTAVQVRDVVKRLAQENRQIIKALLYLARHL